MYFAVFCLAAALVFLLTKGTVTPPGGAPRREGLAFVGSVLASCLVGLYLSREQALFDLSKPVGLTILLLTGLLYMASAFRGRLKLPPFVADIFVLAAAAAAIFLFKNPQVSGIRLPFSNEYVGLGSLAIPLTILFVWAISRMTAALNRTPQVTGGYLGVVGLTFWLIESFGERVHSPFAILTSAALAGAGLASVPVALRRPDFSMGWSAALAMGFLLAQSALLGLWKNMAFAILALLMLVLGLPLLDVSFYRLRVARRGADVKWQETHLRLHEALAKRGLSPLKISALYLALATWLCALGVILVATASWYFLLRALILGLFLFGGILFFFSVMRVLMRRTADEEIPESIEAFGVRISPVSMLEALDRIEEMIKSKKPHIVVTSDANAILRAREDEEYAGILRRAALVTPDGYGVMWGARLLNLPVYERVTGVDMVNGICERAAKHGYSIYIFGSAPGVAATAAQKLQERHPGLTVAGTQHGYYSKEGITEEQVAQQIHDAQPDVLFVAMGIPLQEKFINRHLKTMDVPVSLGVGGSFDVYSERLRRAPEAVQRSGLEWLYRVWQEPWRWKRMGYVPRFMVFAIKEWLGLSNVTRDQKRKRREQNE
jgi:N-acetylglucosaminyldiphosphoundecaprenol N-acetyl-beta-D-mannosaminyltransferase